MKNAEQFLTTAWIGVLWLHTSISRLLGSVEIKNGETYLKVIGTNDVDKAVDAFIKLKIEAPKDS